MAIHHSVRAHIFFLPIFLLAIALVFQKKTGYRMNIEGGVDVTVAVLAPKPKARMFDSRLAINDDDVPLDEIPNVLPDVKLNGGIAVDPLADLAVNLIPQLADSRGEKAFQGIQVFVELFAIVTQVAGPTSANAFATLEVLETDAVHAAILALHNCVAIQTRTLDNDFCHVGTHSFSFQYVKNKFPSGITEESL